ncbi:MAG TPA: GntR family transcriptional regulator [Gemmatimonadaceae bacterium]|nr:GntR family transcriptional regulator [Gemmatimonadaceae bacterium]
MRQASTRTAGRAGAPAPRPAQGGPIERFTLAGATLQAIRERILSGAYAEGDPLRQDAIAAELGVSRIPVREALRQLEVEGLVTFSPHRGAVVSTFSIAEIEELFELRAQIEADLVRRAVPSMTAGDFARAEEILDAFDAAFRKRDVAAWGELNWQLHSTLLAPAQRPLTLGIAERLHRHAERYARMQLALTHGESRASEEHRAIVTAARRHNADRAAQLMGGHITGAGRSLVRFLRAQRGEA